MFKLDPQFGVMLRTGSAPVVKAMSVQGHTLQELEMKTVSEICLDLAKNVFQVHAIDADGAIVVHR